MRRYGALFVLLFALVGSRPQCDVRTPSSRQPITVNMTIETGTCERLYPVSLDLSDLGAIALNDTHAGLWIKVERRPTGNTVWVCADEGMPLVTGERIDFSYVSTAGETWPGTINLWAGDPMQVAATAAPELITRGQTTQLDVVVTGGIPPYAYWWNFTESISGRLDIRDPVAQPAVGEVFSVRVLDSSGQSVWGQVFVDVLPVVVVAVGPDTIDAGQEVNLSAVVSPPGFPAEHLGWGWEPALASGRPVNPELLGTTASPIVPTTYFYTARTDRGAIAADSGHVHVRP